MTLTARANPKEDDSDLQDLLQEEQEEGEADTSTANDTYKKGTTPSTSKNHKYSDYYNNFNKESSSSSSSSSSSASTDCSKLLRVPELICFYFTYFLLRNPFCGKIAVLSLLAVAIYALLSLTSSSTQSIGVIKYDFSTVQSQYDFDIGKVDHWCIKGGNDCACPDPLSPVSRPHKGWHKAVERHTQMIDRVPEPDVVFLGQSLVEVFNGRINGSDRSSDEFFGKVRNYFESRFGGMRLETDDTDARAIAMGLTGDSTANVLWRLLHGELPDDFDPPIWWLVLGMEDVGRYGCSEEITVMGVLRIIEEIKTKRPNAKIVVNSLLPMIKMRMSAADNEKEFVDAQRDHGKGPHPRQPHGRRPKRDNDKYNENGNDHGNGNEIKGGHDGNTMRNNNNNNNNNNNKNNNGGNKTARRVLKEGNDDRDGGGFNGHVGDKVSIKEEKIKEKLVKKYEKDVLKDKFNPQLKDVKTFKKKGRHFENRIPMWSAVHEINKELQKFCKRTPHVTFFDTTSIFTTEGPGGARVLLTDMISPRGHPTVKGFKAWMDVMHQQVGEWKKKMEHAEEMHQGDPNSWTMGNEAYYENVDENVKKFYVEHEHDGEDNEE